jgi:hypothetical protein
MITAKEVKQIILDQMWTKLTIEEIDQKIRENANAGCRVTIIPGILPEKIHDKLRLHGFTVIYRGGESVITP